MKSARTILLILGAPALVFVFALALFSPVLTFEAQAFVSTSTSYKINISELMSISGPSTSTSFKLNSAGGQQATGISTSTSFQDYAGILYAMFATAASGITVSGTVYSNEGITTTTSSVSLSINGGTKTTVATNGSGVYTFPSVTQPVSGDVITAWMDNGDAARSGATVTRYSGSGGITNLHIYQKHLIARHEDAGPLTNANIGLCDSATGTGCADSDLHFNEAAGALTVDNDWGLYLWGASTFTPGGSVTLSNTAASSAYGGDLIWASSTSAISLSNNALSVGGDFDNAAGGTFSTGLTQTTTFTATTTGFFINAPNPFRRITFNGAGGGWSAKSNTLVLGAAAVSENNLTMTNGTLNNDNGTSSITVRNGNVTGSGGIINLTTATFTMTMFTTTTANFGSTSGNWTFNDLVFSNSSTTASTFRFTTLTTGSGNITVGGNLQVISSAMAGNTMALNVGDRTWTLSGSDGVPFELSAGGGSVSFESVSSTFSYTGNNTGGNTTMASTTYWNLQPGGGGGETYVFGTDTTILNDFAFDQGADTVDTTGRSITIAGAMNHTFGTISGTGNITAKAGVTFGIGAVVNLTGGTFEHLMTTTSTMQIDPVGITAITFNNLKMNNPNTTARTLTLLPATPSGGFTVSNDWTIGDNSSGTYTMSVSTGASVPTFDVNRDFAIATNGILQPASSTTQVARNLTITGSLVPASSTIVLDTTATSTITGGTSIPVFFNNLTANTANKPLIFATGTPYFETRGLLTLRGTAGNELKIDSSASGTQWKINHQGTETIGYVTVKDSGCVATSTYITVNYADSVNGGNNGFCWAFPSLSFIISPLSVNLSLNDTNTFTNSATNTLTVSTNAELGYNITAYETALMTILGGTTTIANWTGTNATPTTWNTSCIASATCGFGYSTNDTSLTQFSSTKFAGFTTSTPGDVVATGSGQVTGDATIMTYRSSVNLLQGPGDYQTTVRYIITPGF